MRLLHKFLLIISFLITGTLPARAAISGLGWKEWDGSLFDRAQQENRLVLLDVEAVWCHWCHVMDRETYAHPQVIAELKKHFIPVKVDHEARPDIGQRYQRYGWPATVIFSPQGEELVKLRGYFPPEDMLELLQKVRLNPASVKNFQKEKDIRYSKATVLSEDLRQELERRHRETHDEVLGGMNMSHKFLDADTVEYALTLGSENSDEALQRAHQTLKANLKLIDPVWGGVYQYSHDYDWDHPHYEKIMSFQADNLRIYSLAYGFSGQAFYREAAQSIRRYLMDFLRSPEGSFYTSQDADLKPGEKADEYFSLNDEERRAKGMPRIDEHRYARENGWAIEALARYAMATGDSAALNDAERAAEWILKHRSLVPDFYSGILYLFEKRSLPFGAYRHDEVDQAGPYLGDTLAMGQAWLVLYEATGKRIYLDRAVAAARFSDRTFRSDLVNGQRVGWLSALDHGSLQPIQDPKENIRMTRFLIRMFHYTGDGSFMEAAGRGMNYLSTPEIALERVTDPGILLAASEFSRDPLHLTVVGGKGDDRAKALFDQAIRFPSAYKRVEWFDPEEGPLPNSDISYPELEKSAAFVCLNKICSRPIYEAEKLFYSVQNLMEKKISAN